MKCFLVVVLLIQNSYFFNNNLDSVCDTIELIREAKLKFPVGNSISSLAKDFCMRLLTIKTEFRLTAVEAENHLWI